jgi:hypothetical protein
MCTTLYQPFCLPSCQLACLDVSLSVCLLACLSAFLPVCLTTCMPSFCLPGLLPIYPDVSTMPACMLACLSDFLSVYVCFSACLSVFCIHTFHPTHLLLCPPAFMTPCLVPHLPTFKIICLASCSTDYLLYYNPAYQLADLFDSLPAPACQAACLHACLPACLPGMSCLHVCLHASLMPSLSEPNVPPSLPFAVTDLPWTNDENPNDLVVCLYESNLGTGTSGSVSFRFVLRFASRSLKIDSGCSGCFSRSGWSGRFSV